MTEITITFDDIPSTKPADLARIGELMADAAMSREDPCHPSARAWMRAGIAASAILRHADDGKMGAALLVALIADAAEPRNDESSPRRKALLDGHRSVFDNA